MIFTFFFILFCLIQVRSLITLLVSYFKTPGIEMPIDPPATLPGVLIQLPAYNEGWEIVAAFTAALQQNYSSDKLAIQIIDDSAEQSDELIHHLTTLAGQFNIDFAYLRRSDRNGFKAGALNYGMQFSQHELIVILDCDFIISPDFIRKCVTRFSDPRVAGVQTRWTYRNDFQNPVITAQSTIFETIFVLEQEVRNRLNFPALFTGTSGIWRRKVIEEVGGWKEEPFTAEDIDMSFRSYSQGYGYIFIDEALSSCEATPNFIAFKHQQQRWSRGVWQAGTDNLRGVLRARQSLQSKFLEISNLLINMLPVIILLSVISLAIEFLIGTSFSKSVEYMQIAFIVLLLFGPTAISIYYAVQKHCPDFNRSKRIKFIQANFLAVGLGFAIIYGVLEAMIKSKKEFVVTPKGNNKASFKNSRKKWLSSSYLITILEAISSLFFGYMAIHLFGISLFPAILFGFISVSATFCFFTSLKWQI